MDACDFLKKHGMDPERIDPEECAGLFLDSMEAGLRGESGALPMIPTYLRAEGAVPENTPAAVIDAGGTNFRRALVTFSGGDDYRVEELYKTSMPGVAAPATWEEFIGFTADAIMPLMDRADSVGFCFSYLARETPDLDGADPHFTKQVNISGGEDRRICAALREELERRGVRDKKFVLINDTAAVLLGVSALLDKNAYDGFIGLVSGTGTNTCCMLPDDRVKKLGMTGKGQMLVNLESGYMMDLPRGDFDRLLDEESNDPGRGWHEKMTSGAYLGELARIAASAAADEGLISPKIKNARHMDASLADRWCDGQGLDGLCETDGDRKFVSDVSLALFDRAARCVCANLIGIMLLTGEGKKLPVCVCAEGSLFLKSRHFRPLLEKYMEERALGALGRKFEFRTSSDTTLLGSAAAALLNG
jgi:hexokinase